MKNKNYMSQIQLQLSLPAVRLSRPGSHRSGSSPRAAWWFQHMRQLVDATAEFIPAPGAEKQMAE
jgi:hypothetical protein